MALHRKILTAVGILVILLVAASVVWAALFMRYTAGVWQANEGLRLLSYELGNVIMDTKPDGQQRSYPDSETFFAQPGVSAHLKCPHCHKPFIYTPWMSDGSRVVWQQQPPVIILRSPCLHRGKRVVAYSDFARTLVPGDSPLLDVTTARQVESFEMTD